MNAFPWISMIVSIVVLVIQGLIRYGLAQREELNRKKFEAIEKDIEELSAVQKTIGSQFKTIDSQFTSVLVTLESIKTKQESEYATREKQESVTSALHQQMVSKELFDTRMQTVEANLANISRTQTDILAQFVKWLHKKETA